MGAVRSYQSHKRPETPAATKPWVLSLSLQGMSPKGQPEASFRLGQSGTQTLRQRERGWRHGGLSCPGLKRCSGPIHWGQCTCSRRCRYRDSPLRTVCTWVPGTWGVLQFWKRKRSRGRSLASPGDCALGQDWPREGPSCHLYQDQGVLRIPPVPAQSSADPWDRGHSREAPSPKPWRLPVLGAGASRGPAEAEGTCPEAEGTEPVARCSYCCL